MNAIRSVIASLFRRLNTLLDAYIARRVDGINRARTYIGQLSDATDVYADDAYDLTDRASLLLTADLIASLTTDEFNQAAPEELTP